MDPKEYQQSLLQLNEDQLLSLGGTTDASLENLLFGEFNDLSASSSDSPPLLTSSEHSSPLNSSPTTDGLDIQLLHKPRGSQGVWYPVKLAEGLRVTKGKGKRLKLKLRSNEPFDKGHIEIGLVDMTDQSSAVATKDGFVVESVADIDDPCAMELEVRLTKYCKRLQFLVITKTQTRIIQGQTVEFCSHNNGKANAKGQEAAPFTPLPIVGANNAHVGSAAANMKPINGNGIVNNTVPQPTGFIYADKKRKEPSGDEQRLHVVDGPMEVHGVVRAKAFMQFSDLRLKTNIAELVDALDIISKLQGKSYEWKNGTLIEEESGGKRVIGLIAQEVQKVLPEVVHQDADSGLLSVSYSEIVPVIIEAFKQHLVEYKTDRDDVHHQLAELRSKLDKVSEGTSPEASRPTNAILENKKYTPRMSQFFHQPYRPVYIPQPPQQPIYIGNQLRSVQPGVYVTHQQPASAVQSFPQSRPVSYQVISSPNLSNSYHQVIVTSPAPVPLAPTQMSASSPSFESAPTKVSEKKGSTSILMVMLVIGAGLAIVSFILLGVGNKSGKGLGSFFATFFIGLTLLCLSLFILICQRCYRKRRERKDAYEMMASSRLSTSSTTTKPAGHLTPTSV